MNIVIVDSSRVGMKILSTMLEEHGHKTTLFVDAQQALDFIRCDLSVNVLLTGLELPTMSGFELCWEVRLLTQRGRHIYVVAMSSSDEEGKLIETLDSGADDFLRKPPRIQELLARLRTAERMKAMQEELIKLATEDCLTGILNRRAFFDAAETHMLNASHGVCLSTIMFDIDHFKKVNDRYGHDMGDKALLSVVGAAQREYGVFARMGGEEFAMLLPGVDQDQAMEVAEGLRKDVENLVIETDKKPFKITCSYGVSVWHKGDTIESMLKRADLALYISKESGRNQVQFGFHDVNDFIPDRTEVVELDPNVFELNS